MEKYTTLIAIALIPFAQFFLMYIARIGYIAMQKWMPECKLKAILLKQR
jgi:hypothetical protein